MKNLVWFCITSILVFSGSILFFARSIESFHYVPCAGALIAYTIETCLGSFLSKRVFMVPAHCLLPNITYLISPFHDNSPRTQYYTVESWYKHPRYNITNLRYDIGLLTMTDVLESHNVRPCELPFMPIPEKTTFNSLSRLNGRYGDAKMLQMRHSKCMRMYPTFFNRTTMICGREQAGVSYSEMMTGTMIIFSGRIYGQMLFGQKTIVFQNILPLQDWLTKELNNTIPESKKGTDVKGKFPKVL